MAGDAARVRKVSSLVSGCQSKATSRLCEAINAALTKMVADGSRADAGAIASRRAADLFGLEVLADGVQDYASNLTRILGEDNVVSTPC